MNARRIIRGLLHRIECYPNSPVTVDKIPCFEPYYSQGKKFLDRSKSAQSKRYVNKLRKSKIGSRWTAKNKNERNAYWQAAKKLQMKVSTWRIKENQQYPVRVERIS